MADSETLREYLIKIKYDVDDNSERRMTDAIGLATKSIVALGAALVSAAGTLAITVSKIADTFDRLYYSAQRTNSSVQSLKSLAFAVSQLGGTYQGAMQSIENFGKLLRTNPGYESMVKGLGVVTRQNGKLRETTEIAKDLAKALASQPYYIQYQFAEAFGLDEDTFRALQSGELSRRIEEYARKTRAMGVDMDQASRVGRDLSNVWRDLGGTLEILGTKLMETFGPSIANAIKEFDKWIQEHSDDIVWFIGEIGKALSDLSRDFLQAAKDLKPFIDGLIEVIRTLMGPDGLKNTFNLFATWLEDTWVGKVIKSFNEVLDAWRKFSEEFGLTGKPKGPAEFGAELGKNTQKMISEWWDEWFKKQGGGPAEEGMGGGSGSSDDRKQPGWKRFWNWMTGGGTAAASEMPGGGRVGAGGTAVPGTAGVGTAKVPINKMKAAQESYEFWRGKGLTHEQALGIVANEQAESGFNPRAVGDGGRAHGLYQHHPDRRANIYRGTGINISTADANQQREGAYWEMTQGGEKKTWEAIKNAKTPEEAAAIFSSMFERPAARNEAARNRAAIARGWDKVFKERGNIDGSAGAGTGSTSGGGTGVTGDTGKPSSAMSNVVRLDQQTLNTIKANSDLAKSSRSFPTILLPSVAPSVSNDNSVDMNQKNEINIYGASDTDSTAKALGREMDSQNSRLLRNLQGATR